MKVLTDNQHYQDIAEAILAKTGGTTPLKPAEMAPALNNLNIELEEAYVTPTSEPQEILPGEGFYGFSKIIVDAAPEGGDSGSGGSGGGGDSYPNGDDTPFGYDFTEVPEEADEEQYGAYVIPASPLGLPYQIMQRDDDGTISAHAADAPYEANYAGTTLNMVSFPTVTEYSSYDPVTGTWSEVETNTDVASVSVVIHGTLIYLSHNIDSNGDLYLKKTESTKFVNGNYVGAAVEREETYTIDSATMNEIGGSIQKLTGTTEPMTPSQMAIALANIPVIEATYPDAEEETF